jgi:hypothetical protein
VHRSRAAQSGQRQPGTVALELFGHIGLDLMPARLAPND